MSSGNGELLARTRGKHRSQERILKGAERAEQPVDEDAAEFRKFLQGVFKDPTVRQKIKERILFELESGGFAPVTVSSMKHATENLKAAGAGSRHLHLHFPQLQSLNKDQLLHFASTGLMPGEGEGEDPK